MTVKNQPPKKRRLARIESVTPDCNKPDKRPVGDKRMFITTADEHTKYELERQGFVYFAKSDDRYFFSYDERRIKYTQNFDQLTDIEFTDLLTF